MRRGVWLFPSRPAPVLVEAVAVAEQAGLDEIWIADEGVAREPVAVLSAASCHTQRIQLATGITSPVLRHPGAIAASLATLDELSGGRALLGIGIGGDLALEPLGLVADRPVARLREAIDTARGVFEQRPTTGYRPPPHAMPPRPVPIWVGARGPQLVRTAARHADGLFLSGCSPDQLTEIRANADSAGGTSLAIYQTATAAPSKPSEHAWHEIARVLRVAVRELGPASVGINLVDPTRDTSVDLLAEIHRAADVLHAL